ncbi:MAG: hypothetical protein FWF60_08300 [Oscillospiraceae bacterium]|nr:hypothetical protein [Oscillospiraceae bacterium]
MSNKRLVLTIMAIVLLSFVCFFSFIAMHYWDIDPVGRYDLTPGQQEKIARALGFDLAPGETLTAYYYPSVWPGTIEMLSVHTSFGRNHYVERGDPGLKKVQGMINNQWEPWLSHFIFWGSLAAEAILIKRLISIAVKRRKAKREQTNFTPKEDITP